MSGLIGHIRAGRLGRDDTAVFLHSGGTPAVFAYAEERLKEWRAGRAGAASMIQSASVSADLGSRR